MNKIKLILKGIIKENPTFVLVLGMCPTLGTTTSAMNGMGMGLATTFVLMLSNMVISSMARMIPEKVRIPAYVVVIAVFDAGLRACVVRNAGPFHSAYCGKLHCAGQG